MNHLSISTPSLSDFELITKQIALLELDDRDLQAQQFLVAKKENALLGFGRIRKHPGCDEYCSLGILPNEQNKGMGKKITQAILLIATQPIYLVCIIPAWFKPFGFKVVKNYPSEIQNKLDYCNNALTVPEEYVVMKYFTSPI